MPQYLDWEKGKVILENSEVYNLCNGQNSPTRVNLNDFSEFDQVKIKSYCKSNFERMVETLLERYINVFKEQYSNSKEKDNLLYSTIEQIKAILEFGMLVSSEMAIGLFWNRVFHINELKTIRNHYTEHIVKGIPLDYCIFQREDSPFKFNGDHLVVQAEMLWRFKNFLLNFNKQVVQKNQREIEMAVSNKKGEFKEYDKEIFVDELSFHFFCAILIEFLSNKKPTCARVSFIFYRFNGEGYFKKMLTHNVFIEYLITKFNYEIDCVKLRQQHHIEWDDKFLEIRSKFFDEV